MQYRPFQFSLTACLALACSWPAGALAQDRELQWHFQEQLRLGTALGDPAESFHRLTPYSIAHDSTGLLYVLDPGNRRIQVFSRDGEYVRTISREGQGPGEVMNPVSIWSPDGENIWVFDWAMNRVSSFTPNGELLGDYSAPFGRGKFMYAGPDYEAFDFTEGLRTVKGEAPDSTVQRLYVVRSGDTIEVARLPLVTSKQVTFFKPCRFRIDIMPLFEPRLVWDLAAGRIAVNSSYSYDILVKQLDGSSFRVSREIQPRKLTREDAIEAIGDPPYIPNPRGRACGRFDADDILEKRGYYPYEQLIDRIQIAPDGALWVKRKSPETDNGEIDVFSPMGDYLGTLPEDAPYPDAFTADGGIVRIELTDLDVEQVVVYQVLK